MPIVSVIIPCYNEQATILKLLEALYHQEYPRQDMEVIIADGFSTDETRQKIGEFQQAYPDLRVRLIDNPRRTIPAALNRGIAAAEGQYIIRLDAHSIPCSGYVAHCIQALENGSGDNVGGVWEIRPTGEGWIARAIAAAAAHPLAVGDALYRYTGKSGIVDTVPFGAFRRELADRLGGFDENLLTNEDYEFNVRVRQSGGKIWLDPSIRSVYFARGTLGALARQYWRYGFWKARMLRRYPHTLRWRQALPPLFVMCLGGLAFSSIWLATGRYLFAMLITIYLLILILAGLHLAAKKGDFSLMIGVPLAIATMHICWGAAVIWSLGNAIWTKT